MTSQVVELLECDPALGEGLDAKEREIAERSLPVHLLALERGEWLPDGAGEPGRLGYLVVEGLVIRRVRVGGGSSVELLGEGDLLRPWQEDVSSFCTASWEVLDPAAVADLGHQVSGRLGRWPTIVDNLLSRGVRRSRALAAEAAIASIVGIEQRLLILLWQLAERWGEVVDDGIVLRLQLPHRLLAELTGSRRPSVTTALTALQEDGHLDSTAEGRWILLGDPPA